MPVFEAKRLCPELVLVKPDHLLYSQVSDRIMQLLSGYSPKIEQNSIDEAWIDMTNTDKYYMKSYSSIAGQIQKEIYREEEIPCSIGISFTKFLANMAAEIKKPNGIVMLDRSNFRSVLFGLDIAKMHGCGSATTDKLKLLGIKTIGELAGADPYLIKKNLGIGGIAMQQNANGISTDEIGVHVKNKSISRETTFSKDLISIEEIQKEALPLIEDVARQIREKKYCFSTVYITIKYNDFSKVTRQKKVKVSNDRDIIFESVKCLLKNNEPKKPVRLFGVGVSEISDDCVFQQDLFSNENGNEQIYKVIDEKNKKFGRDIIKRGFY
jgi:DNA polymerase-4